METHIVIPARFASTRLPGKPLREIAGKPMLWHVYQRAVEAQLGDVVVATDDQRIADVANSFGATVCMTASNHISGTDRLAEVIAASTWPDSDVVVNLQGDEPLMPPTLLRQVATNLRDRSDAQMATLCSPIEHDDLFSPHAVKVVFDCKGYALYFSRATIPWYRDAFAAGVTDGHLAIYRHLGIYAYRVGFLRQYPNMSPAPIELAESLEQLRVLWHGGRIHVGIAECIPATGVDTEEDLARVNQFIMSAT